MTDWLKVARSHRLRVATRVRRCRDDDRTYVSNTGHCAECDLPTVCVRGVFYHGIEYRHGITTNSVPI